jgi:hypothetical protein
VQGGEGLGQATASAHEAVVFHSINGSFAIQQGDWKLELCSLDMSDVTITDTPYHARMPRFNP